MRPSQRQPRRIGRNRRIGCAITAAGVFSVVGAAHSEEPLVAYAPSASPTALRERSFNGTGWDAEVGIGTLGASLGVVSGSASGTGEVAVATVDSSRGLRLSIYANGAWDGGSTLTASTGALTNGVVSVRHECVSEDVLVVYRSGTATAPRYRTRSGGVLSAELNISMGLPSAPDEIVTAARAGSNEILVLARSGGTIAAAVWSGDTFSSPVTLTTSARTSGWPMSGCLEGQSGDGLAVWSEGTAVKYATRVGAWNPAATLSSPGGTVNVVRLVANANKSSNAAVLCYSTSSGVVDGVPWTGSAWGSTQRLDSSGPTSTYLLVDAAWQGKGNRAVVAWARPNSATLRSRTWNGSAWSGETAGPTLSSNITRVRLGVGRGPDTVVGALRRMGILTLDDYIVYADGSLATGSTVIQGEHGANAAGIDLPAPPACVPGTTNMSYGNGVTTTLAPGSYGDYSWGNSCTINLSSGTYHFRRFQPVSSNGLRIVTNTAGGDVTVIVCEGGVDVKNGAEFINTGGNRLVFEIVSGNFDSKNNLGLTDVAVRCYNGSIDIENNTSSTASLWASGNITLGSGSISPVSWYSGGNRGPLDGFAFAGGVPSAATALSATTQGTGPLGGFDLATMSEAKLRLRTWTQIAPD